MSEPFEADDVLDTSGLYCPEPIMLMHNKVRDLGSGKLLRVIATDPATTRDIPQFCAFLGHQLLERREEDGRFEYLLRLA
ncbi:sulfurtransferase TusA [Halotalea alkalilenta]|uniref:sulfurtransferase TusA n=1 Tax=Halotalea alkalilenta TaxID=376489 RepID=UPI0004857C91|nr:sulfurtransferase TusA [Halotalea alkalilenta]